MSAEPYTEAALRQAGRLDAPARPDAVDGAIDARQVGEDDVLVLRALGLGDALTGIAPIRGLHRLFPDRRVVLAAPATIGGWMVRMGVVDAVLATPGLVPLGPLPGGHVAVDLHGRGPESQRLLAAGGPGRLIGFDCPEIGHRGPRWVRDEHEVLRWCRVVRDAGGECGVDDLRLRDPHEAAALRREDGIVVVHPGAASRSRRWPVDRWAAVAGELVRSGRDVVVTGSPGERDLTAGIVAAVPAATDAGGRLDLDDLAALVADAALVLSGDTGIAHLATALATPSVTLFGPVPPRWWGPTLDPRLHTVLWRGDPTADAWGDPHADVVDPRLDAIGVDEMLDATRDLLETTTGRISS
ncbi:glycosyltransferase family 9 protein [Dietzia aurantiaca]|uniref:glycosyltransferase family 9 protein n=1 Tax=Dietzia aurantiaca TaxID=983873 RepID=UPI001E5B9696|nr:glycosyltransferase family 9 protein [Dietzia aurantiaca]MCD2261156.1 glycosyltransferase family 9 protein [Dietzia aurantiaca]